jgi:GAF domain-containing protein
MWGRNERAPSARRGKEALVGPEVPLTEELSAVYARMSGLLLSHETVQTALGLVTALAIETVPGSAGAGVTLLDEHGTPTTTAATDPLVARADQLQYDLDEGPCLTAWSQRAVIRIDDVDSDDRWPRWSRAVRSLGLRSALSAGLVAGDIGLGAMKVYALERAAFDGRTERLIGLFAAQAAILLANVHTYQQAERVSSDLKEALRSRDLIGRAEGVLMCRHGVDENGAFALLTAAATRENRKLREIAAELVRSVQRGRR